MNEEWRWISSVTQFSGNFNCVWLAKPLLAFPPIQTWHHLPSLISHLQSQQSNERRTRKKRFERRRAWNNSLANFNKNVFLSSVWSANKNIHLIAFLILSDGPRLEEENFHFFPFSPTLFTSLWLIKHWKWLWDKKGFQAFMNSIRLAVYHFQSPKQTWLRKILVFHFVFE